MNFLSFFRSGNNKEKGSEDILPLKNYVNTREFSNL